MNADQLVRDTLREWAEETKAPVGSELAERALRRRSRRRGTAVAGAVAALTLAVGGTTASVLLSQAGQQQNYNGPRGGPNHPVSRGESPPRHLVAAGDLAVSAYRSGRAVHWRDGLDRTLSTWYLYDTRTERYEKTPWGFLDVAPGMRRAAVLEKTLPAPRVGILDLTTGKVTRWIALDHGAGGVAWSPDGDRLAVTTYSGYPDIADVPAGHATHTLPGRTGYYVIDAASGEKRYHRVTAALEGRSDVGWNRDGTRIKAPAPTDRAPTAWYAWYDLRGRSVNAPPYEDDPGAGRSPDGRYYTTGGRDKAAVKDTRTHRTVGHWSAGLPVAWTRDDRLLRWEDCGKRCGTGDDVHERLVLTDPAGHKVTPLTGYQVTEGRESWHPVITRR